MINNNRGDSKMEREMNVFEIIQAFMKRYKLVLGIVLVFALLGGGVSLFLAEQEYQSTATLIVGEETQKETDQINPINGEPIYETVIQYGNSSISEQSKSFYSETLDRQDLLNEVIENLELEWSASELRQRTNLDVPENSSSLFISVNSSQYKEVDKIVDEIVKVFIGKVYEITEVEKIKVLDDASEPTLISSINYLKNILIAVVLGLALSFVLVLVLEYFDDSIQSVADIERKLDLPVVGVLKSKETLTENLKEIRTNLDHSKALKEKKNILLTSASRSNPEITSNLAEVMSQGGKNTLLMDADLRTPSIHDRLGLSNESGLSNLLSKDSELSKSLQTLVPNLQVLTAGKLLENPSEKLSSHRMKQLLSDIQESFDYILIHGHSINEVTDSVALATATDGVLLLIKENETKQSEIENIKKIFSAVEVEILGVIYDQI